MSSLAVRFTKRMCKRAASAEGETTPKYEVPSCKRPKRLGLDEEVQKIPAIVTLDSSE